MTRPIDPLRPVADAARALLGHWQHRVRAVACDTSRGGTLAIELAAPADPIDGASAPLSADEARRWEAMCRRNPKLHDGAIWSVVSLEATPPAAGAPGGRVALGLTPQRYCRLALEQERPATAGEGSVASVRLLGAKAVILAEALGPAGAAGAAGAAGMCVLLARRSPATRAYPGMWEVAPGGGVDRRPGPAAPTPTPADVVLGLAGELRDELGHDWSRRVGAAWVVGAVDDTIARSVDVIVCARWGSPVAPGGTAIDPVGRRTGRWEVTEATWLDLAAAPRWLDGHRDQVTPATLAALSLLGEAPSAGRGA